MFLGSSNKHRLVMDMCNNIVLSIISCLLMFIKKYKVIHTVYSEEQTCLFFLTIYKTSFNFILYSVRAGCVKR